MDGLLTFINVLNRNAGQSRDEVYNFALQKTKEAYDVLQEKRPSYTEISSETKLVDNYSRASGRQQQGTVFGWAQRDTSPPSIEVLDFDRNKNYANELIESYKRVFNGLPEEFWEDLKNREDTLEALVLVHELGHIGLDIQGYDQNVRETAAEVFAENFLVLIAYEQGYILDQERGWIKTE